MNINSLFGFFNNTAVGQVYDESFKFVPTDQMLSQSELQMLQRIVAYYIRISEEGRQEIKEDALKFPVGSDERNILFSDYRKAKEKSKKLSALQYRLKHEIATMG